MDRQVRDSSRSCFCFCRRKKEGKYWVNDEYYDKQNGEEDGLVPTEKPSKDEKAVEMNNFSKKEEVEEPLLTLEAQPVAEEMPDGPNMDNGKTRHSSRDSDRPRSRLSSALTRAEVIRMAKKSDASRDEAQQYETPAGSKENLADEETPTIMYTPMNQEELDEELRQFRTFYAQRQSKKFASTSTPVTSNKTITTVTTTTTVIKTKKKDVEENGPDEVFENGVGDSSPDQPPSPKEKRESASTEPEEIETTVRQETQVEETVTTSVLVRASDLEALALMVASEDGEGASTEDTTPSINHDGGYKDLMLDWDDDDWKVIPQKLPTREFEGDAVVEDDITITSREKVENIPDLESLDSWADQSSQDLTTVSKLTVENGTDKSKEEQDASASFVEDVMSYFSDRDKSESEQEWGRLVNDLKDT